MFETGFWLLRISRQQHVLCMCLCLVCRRLNSGVGCQWILRSGKHAEGSANGNGGHALTALLY